jgi:hypothetical protein
MENYYIYHQVPPDFKGTTLYPLNELKNIFPDSHKNQVAKYDGRERLLEQRVGILDCLWNDVLHFSPVHPAVIKSALNEAGMNKKKLFRYFEVDPRMLDKEKLVIFLYPEKKKGDFDIQAKEFVKFDYEKMAQLSILPDATKEYYKKVHESSEKIFFMYHRVPHVLYKGSIDIKNISVIEA